MTVSKVIAVITLAGAAACASPIEKSTDLIPAQALDLRPADVADLASTAGFLASGNGVEVNPIIAGSSTAETLVRGGILKLGARAAINAVPMEDTPRKNMHTFMDATGYGATVNNIPLIFGGSAAPALGVLVGLGYFLYNMETQDE